MTKKELLAKAIEFARDLPDDDPDDWYCTYREQHVLPITNFLKFLGIKDLEELENLVE